MVQRRYSSDYKALQPFVREDIRSIVNAAGLGGGATGGGGGVLAAHALSDTSIHTGQLAQGQATWAVTDAEFLAHAADPDAHHPRAHVLATNTGLGGDHSISGAVAGWVLRATASNAARMAQLGHDDLSGVTANQHHSQVHGIVGGDHTVTGSQYQIVGLPVAANTLGLLTPSATPAANTIVRTGADSAVRLVELTVTDDLFCDGVLDFGVNTIYEDATYLRLTGSKALLTAQNIGNANWTIYNAGGAEFRGNLDVLAGGDLTVAGSGAYAGNPVIFADSSGGNVGILGIPDPQFALDVFGPVRAQYFIGPHAIQLKNVLLLAHYDGREPAETNTSGEPNGHMGQVATVTGGVIFRPGKFGKAAQLAGATTNLLTNPSFETGIGGWTAASTGTSGGNFFSDTFRAYVGGASARLVASVGGNYLIRSSTVTLAAGEAVTVQCRMYRGSAIGAQLQIRDNTNGSTRATASPALTDEWELLTCSWTNTTGAAATVEMRVSNTHADGSGRVWVDACQMEKSAYATPYCDGSLGGYSSGSAPDGTGHAWTGTAHASTSTRVAARLSYPASGNLNAGRGTLMAWVYVMALTGSDMTVLRATGTAAGNIILQLDSLGKPRAWAGTAAVTAANPIPLRAWAHLAATYDGTTVRLYVNGLEVANGSSSGFDGMPENFFVGRNSSAADWLNGWLDDLCTLPYVAAADLLLSVVESDAPVFAETARYGFRATPKNLVWADDEGLWMRDILGNPVLGIYGGEALTKSWGGFTLAAGDLVIGRNAVGSSAMRWVQTTGKFGFYGGGNSTPQVEIGTDGRITAINANLSGLFSGGGGNVLIDSDGERIYRAIEVVTTGSLPPTDFSLSPNLTPSASQSLQFRDTAAVFTRTGSPPSYSYPGNALLRIYTSSRHWVPPADPLLWEHHLYGVIEVPTPDEAGDGNSYFSELRLKARSITLESVAGVGVRGQLFAESIYVDGDANVYGTILAGGDDGGQDSTVGLTNVADTTVSTGTGTVKMNAGTARNSDAWVKIYIGTVAYWLPAWSNIN